MVGYMGTFDRNYNDPNSWTDIETNNRLQYQYFPVGDEELYVRIKTTREAHIGFTSVHQEMGPLLEVIIGREGNTMSIIRKNKQEVVKVGTPEILNGSEHRGFWIRFHNGLIYVGRELEPLPFMAWTDPDPFHIVYGGVCTGYGATGSWSVGDMRTGADLQYQYFPVSNGKIKFKVKAFSDAYIALAEEIGSKKSVYEVKIGHLRNQSSAVQRKGDSKVESHTATPNILNPDKYSGFWITWNNGVVSVGHDGDTKPFVTVTDPAPFPVFFAGFGTYTVPGLWKIIDTAPDFLWKEPEAGMLGNWISASDGLVPVGAIVAGYDTTGETTYVARSASNHMLGVLIPSTGYAMIVWNGDVHRENQYQVLVNCPSNNWVATCKSNIPAGALPLEEKGDGQTVYIGRVHRKGVVTVGKVLQSRGICVVSLLGELVECSNYEVLMSYC